MQFYIVSHVLAVNLCKPMSTNVQCRLEQTTLTEFPVWCANWFCSINALVGVETTTINFSKYNP